MPETLFFVDDRSLYFLQLIRIGVQRAIGKIGKSSRRAFGFR